MNRFNWLIKRELWENRSIWLGMPIAAGILVVASLFGFHGVQELTLDPRFTPDKQAKIVAAIYLGITMLFFIWAFFQSFFYAVDALYGDRRDRSVLFWKSLPLSDSETVLSKAATALVVVPLVAMASSVIAQWGVAIVGSIRLGNTLLLDPTALLAGVAVSLYIGVIFALWYAPVVGYLLAWSAWAPRNPFLYAVLPPVILSIAEKLLFHTNYIGTLVGSRLTGVLTNGLGAERDGAFFGVQVSEDQVTVGGPEQLLGLMGDFFTDPALWAGLVAAALLFAAAVWIRRYRDESL
ncbi:MAG: hypothetical protein IT483_13020 [Gammaproteobacteria bacterium]|nr:hypothetical protein [Gammaproteobacteria bacterium]